MDAMVDDEIAEHPEENQAVNAYIEIWPGVKHGRKPDEGGGSERAGRNQHQGAVKLWPGAPVDGQGKGNSE